MGEAIVANPLPTTEEYPYILNTGRDTVGQWHTQSRTREMIVVEESSAKKAYIYIHPDLASEKGIQENDLFKVSSINGQSSLFHAKLSKHVTKNQLFAPLHYQETNALTPSLFDTFSKEPSYKTTPINVTKLEGGSADETN